MSSILFFVHIKWNMKKFCVSVLAVFMLFCCCACGKKDNLIELGKDLSQYNITLDINAETKSVVGNLNLTYINNSEDVLKNVMFHLYPQFFEEGNTDKVVSSTILNDAYPNGMSYAEFDVDRVQVAGQDVTVVYSGECDGILDVTLPSSILPSNSVDISINFSFSLPNCEHRFGYGDNTINLANFYPIACVYENGEFDLSGYNSNGDPFYSEMSNYVVDVVLDRDYVVAGTGTKANESIVDGRKHITFNANVVRDFALIASDKFEVRSGKAGDVTIEYYYFNDEHADQSLQAGVDAIETFSNLFGDYPYSSFSIVKTDFIYGGMEYPNLVMISADIENVDDYMNVIVHETAHQWWYGLVGNDEYQYPWLDEALTEYSTLLFYDNNDGYNLTHSQMLNAYKSNYTLFITVYQDVLGDIDTSMRAIDEYDTEPEYTYCTYVKGVLMYESLYQLIGEDKFLDGLKNYFNSKKYTNATPEDLISSFESASKTELDSFFDSWISGKVVIR